MTDAEYITMLKSTIVRSYKEPRWLPLVRAGNRLLSRVAPRRAAGLAQRLFLAPPRRRRSAPEISLLATARARPMEVGGRRIETWRWGSGPAVLLVHGWGGRGTQLGAFVQPLVAHGFSVITFDAPGHGASDSGVVTIPEMVTALRAVTASPRRLAGIVAHSIGGTVAARALYEGVQADAAVFIGAPAHLVESAARFTESLGFSKRVGELMRERIEQRAGAPFSAFDMSALAAAQTTPLLAVHDRGDAEVAWQHALFIGRAWRGAEVLTTDGLGHRRILRAPDVVAAAVAFIAARAAESRVPMITPSRLEETLATG